MNILYNKIKYNIKINSRKYMIFIFSFCLFLLLFHFYASQIIVNYNELQRINSPYVNEIWFLKAEREQDCFINLNGKKHLITNNKKINGDIFMQIDKVEYKYNLMNFNKKLNKNECAISKNVRNKYNLKIGDSIKFNKTNEEVIVRYIIESQMGIDPKYQHEGMIILGFDLEKVKEINYNFIVFLKDADFIFDKVDGIDPIYLSKKVDNIKYYLTETSIPFVIIMIFIMILLEFFIFRRKLIDYNIEFNCGIKKFKLINSIFLDMLFKYLLPIILIFIIYSNYLINFKKGYLFLLLYIIPVILTSLIITSIYYKKESK